MLYTTPWMIKSHAPKNHVGRTLLKPRVNVIADELLFPRWDHVKTYNLLVIMELERADKNIVAYLHNNSYNVVCICEEYTSHEPLIQMSWGTLGKSRLYHDVKNASTPEPRPSAKGRDFGPPRCIVLARPKREQTQNETTLIEKGEYWLRWEVIGASLSLSLFFSKN